LILEISCSSDAPGSEARRYLQISSSVRAAWRPPRVGRGLHQAPI